MRYPRVVTQIGLFAALFTTVSLGQTDYRTRKAEIFPAVKYAELGEVPRESWEKELTAFADSGRAYRRSRLYVIVYAAMGTSRTSVGPIVREYDLFLRRTVNNSIPVMVEPGGYRKHYTAELWIVSEHDNLPEPMPDARFRPEKAGEMVDLDSEKLAELFRDLVAKIGNQPDQLVIINYGTSNEIADRERAIAEYLRVKCQFDGPRTTLISGGPGPGQLTTFWVVPPGAANPKP